jgi:hypothetical protein
MCAVSSSIFPRKEDLKGANRELKAPSPLNEKVFI